MPLGSHVPAWVALRRELEILVAETSSENAYVLDAWGNVWCAAQPALGPARKSILKTALAELEALRPPLQRGGRLDRMLGGFAEHTYARSFATVYVLLVSFPGAAPTPAARKIIAAALPRIEALTVALPPTDDPGPGSAQGFGLP